MEVNKTETLDSGALTMDIKPMENLKMRNIKWKLDC
jgi:hypothetical protein